MGKPAATGEERGKLKRKHEEEEQEDDRPWKSRRLGEATAMPTFIARQEPGPAYRVSCLKGSITSSKVNVTNFATDKGCEPPKSVHFHMDAQQKHISRYEIRNRGHYHRPRVLPDGKVVGKSWQPGRWTARPGEELLDTSGLYQQAENFLWSLSKGKAMVPYVGPDEIANYIRAREMERHLREAEQALNALQRAWRKCAGIAGKLPWVGSFMPRAARRIGALEQARRRWRADGFAGQGYKLPPNSLL
ncbi:hypothetical protein EV356DRAFT_76269 [Viridothelium virens]|uniref:Uncharacterized protein n=1 Tax=Viridothelium virens TaxID=1048519 RepID=A0A6A6HDN8_VIRVR|nr:hypothetical protein EV356DRAFT_76269 [Viridothelium virens]